MTTMTEAQHRPSFLDRPIGVVFILFAFLAVWVLQPVNFSIVFLAAIIVLLFLGLRRPVWAIAALIVHQFTILSYMLDTPFGIQISLQLILTLLVGLIVWRSYRQGQFQLGWNARKIILPAVVLIAIVIVSNVVNSGVAVAWNDFRDWIVGFMVLCFIPAAVNDLQDLKILGGVFFIIVTASALIGIMQHFNILGTQDITLVPGLASHMHADYRVPGMSESALELAYLLVTALMVMLGVAWYRGMKPGIKWLVPVSILLTCGALYFTYTRSAVIAAAFGFIALVLFIKTRIQSPVILIVFILAAALMVISPLGLQGLSGRSTETQEEGTISRVILWQAGLNIALNNPILGIGSNNFSSISEQYQGSVDPSLIAYEKREYWNYQTLGSEPPHNDFINIWLSYGTPALAVFVWLFVVIISTYLKSFRISHDKLVKGVAIGLAAAFVAYGINSLYHNMLATMLLFWILGGFALATHKLAAAEKKPGADS